MLTSSGKKVEVFLFYHLKRCLNDFLDRTVRRGFTGKNEEIGDKKGDTRPLIESFVSP